MLQKIIEKLSEKPGTVFIIDSIGAMTTAFLLFVVLRSLIEYVGLPEKILTCLSLIAVCFWVYSTTCFFVIKRSYAPFIRGIGIANLLYCALTFGLIFFYSTQLTVIGIAYFIGEIAIICGLVFVEFSVAAAIGKR